MIDVEEYIVVIGGSYLTDYSFNIINGEIEYFAKIREECSGPYIFNSEGSASNVAKHLGGVVARLGGKTNDR